MDRSTTIRFDDALPLDAPPRLDLYGPVHKGLRSLMFDTVARLGRCDADDAAELAHALSALRTLLAVCEGHLQHEDEFVHAALEARRSGSSGLARDDHLEHVRAIAELRGLLEATATAPAAVRAQALYRLYLRTARFVAENLGHMELEETHNTWFLRDAYGDAELAALHERLLASIPPEEFALIQRWILGAVSHGERTAMLAGLRDHAPPPVFDATVARCRDVLAPNDWAKLARALGLPAVAGLVEIW